MKTNQTVAAAVEGRAAGRARCNLAKAGCGRAWESTPGGLRVRIKLNADGLCRACVCALEEAAAAPAPADQAAGRMQTVETAVLAAAARGELDLNAIARQELASRGLNHQGRWVGFAEAARLATLHPVRRADGKVTLVSVPENEN